MMLDTLTYPTFAEQRDTPFHVEDSTGNAVEVRLVEATEIALDVSNAFSLTFQGPSSPVVPQGTYRFRHKEIGAFDLFVSPIRRERDASYYEAFINRLLGENGA